MLIKIDSGSCETNFSCQKHFPHRQHLLICDDKSGSDIFRDSSSNLYVNGKTVFSSWTSTNSFQFASRRREDII